MRNQKLESEISNLESRILVANGDEQYSVGKANEVSASLR